MLDAINNWLGSLTPEWVQMPARIGVAVVILLVGIFLSKLVSGWVRGGVNKIGFVKEANADSPANKTVGHNIGQAVFWVLMLLVIAAVAAALGMTAMVEPVQGMMDQVMAFVPNLFGAALIFIVGGIFALVAQRAVYSLASAAQLDDIADSVGMKKTEDNDGLSKALSWIVYALIIIPISIEALNKLQLESISGPATDMLDKVWTAIPNVLAAGFILFLAFMISRFVKMLITNVLPQFGIDDYAKKMHLLSDADEGVTATGIIATLASIAILLFGLVEATRFLGFDALTQFVTTITQQGGSILFGVVIILGGVILSNIAGKAIGALGSGATDTAATAVRYVILGLASLMGIARMELDPWGGSFILVAAVILLVGTALGLALAFGLGGKDWAAAQLEKMRSSK